MAISHVVIDDRWETIHTCSDNTSFTEFNHETNPVKATTNTLRPRQNDRQFLDDILKCIYKFRFHWRLFPRVQLTIFQHWHWPGDKPLSETMMVSSQTHMCVTRPEWVNSSRHNDDIWCNDVVTDIAFIIAFTVAYCLSETGHLPNDCSLISDETSRNSRKVILHDTEWISSLRAIEFFLPSHTEQYHIYPSDPIYVHIYDLIVLIDRSVY